MSTTDTSLRPTIVVAPDSRFATTFLSTKYRDRAVNGEALMDKSNGELFIKRADGKIVSFYQNKKVIEDIALELSTLLETFTEFQYPKSNNTSAFYVSTNYDLVTINNEKLYNLTTDNVTIPGGPQSLYDLSFKVTGNSNGFFCRNTTRDVDKPLIEFVTNQYNYFLKEYSGADGIFMAEHNKFANPKWEGCNATITYSLDVYNNGVNHTFNNIKDYIRLNEDSCIIFPQEVYDAVTSFEYATVMIHSITYDKIQFMTQHKTKFGTAFEENFNKLIYADNFVCVNEFNVIHFINDANDIKVLGNETIVSLLDMARIQVHLDRMTSLKGDYNLIQEQIINLENKINKTVSQSGIQISETQPEFPCIWFKPTE